ncbi:hypothetical protein UFOVP434_63 [uncultured Caudovirales phage]|uniref:Uncharacterized protein n=1 Tax=uncultured Caudovirales phage TaxID=2100421 RepID=A0A6J5MH49_9CAUD|nr:hypothetical protein UFOVP434_63 [uncultured Caudovirales phage]
MALPNNTATISAGETFSTIIAKGAKTFTKCFVQNFNATGNLTFQASIDGNNFFDITTYSPESTTPNVLFTISTASGPTTNFVSSFSSDWLMDINFIRLRANTTLASGTCSISCF